MKFDRNKYKVYTWRHLSYLFWILNPLTFVLEVILGRRTPKISVVDKTLDKPLFERSFFPCPHCESFHDARIWSEKSNRLNKNWFGIYCFTCGKIIPCIMSVSSWIILAVTFPFWGWFRTRMKKNWLKKQPERYENISLKNVENEFSRQNWLVSGIKWGIFMYIFMVIVFPFLIGDEITWKTLTLGIVVWLIGGVLFGYMMQFFMNKKPSKITR